MKATIPAYEHLQNSDFTRQDRIKYDNAYIRIQDVDSITYRTFIETGSFPRESVISGSIDESVAITDTLDTDWDRDNVGYNFSHTFSAEHIARGNATYRIEILFNLVDGGKIRDVFRIKTVNIYSE